jgi:hypothetical protein
MTEPSVARLFSWQELMLEQERLSCDPVHAARAEEFREGNEQMDRQEEQIAHKLKIITPANLHMTAPWRRFTPKFTNSPPTPRVAGRGR